MIIRKSTLQDLNEILRIYEIAREYMVANGNPNQWEAGYPGREIVEGNIANGSSHVIEKNGIIVGTFLFFIGEEPDYRVIRMGKWKYEKPYGTIHLVASDGSTKGITKACFDYCTSQIDYVRIDTHKNNLTMQNALRRYGFQPRGVVTVRNGERIAFDYA